MAQSKVQNNVENWIVAAGLPQVYGQEFKKDKVRLKWGGLFEVDAISEDKSIACCISTSSALTASGKGAIGKRYKIKADSLMMLSLSDVRRKVLVFTEKDMLEFFLKERQSGRFAENDEIELLHIEIPKDLRKALARAKRIAAAEVTPSKKKATRNSK